jgi:DNA-binding LytR/AlgR family response regulator
MIRAIAIDDEPVALKVLKCLAEGNPRVQWLAGFTLQVKAAEFLKTNHVDLIFQDIQMPGGDGLSFFESLENKPSLILTTAHPDYALRGFDVGAYDYLLKPISQARFDQAIDALLAKTAGRKPKVLLINVKHGKIQLDPNELIWAESFGDNIQLHLTQGRKHELRMPLKQMKQMLESFGFAQVHRSYLVNVAKIEFVRNGEISIGGKQIPIGRTYRSPI